MIKKNKKFNIKKSCVSLAMAGFMALSVGLMSGCSSSTGKSAYDLAVDKGFSGTLEQWLDSLRGVKGEKGDAGDDIYIGYDGYAWTGKTRSSTKLANILEENTVENTFGLLAHSNYFNTTKIDMSKNQVALLNHYFEDSKQTVYSGLTITELGLYTQTAGRLTIGTSAVNAVVANRKSGSFVKINNPIVVDLVAGINILNLDISVPAGHTIVFGGGAEDTAVLLSYEGIQADDKQGEYSLITKGVSATDDELKKTEEVADKIIVKTTFVNYTETPTIDITRCTPGCEITTTEFSFGNQAFASFLPEQYMRTYRFKTISKIQIPIFYVSSISEYQYIPFYLVDTATKEVKASREYRLYIDVEDLQDAVRITPENCESLGFSSDTKYGGKYLVKKWITFDKIYDVQNHKFITELELGDDTIAWGGPGFMESSIMFTTPTEKARVYYWDSYGNTPASGLFNLSIEPNVFIKEKFTLQEHLDSLD